MAFAVCAPVTQAQFLKNLKNKVKEVKQSVENVGNQLTDKKQSRPAASQSPNVQTSASSDYDEAPEIVAAKNGVPTIAFTQRGSDDYDATGAKVIMCDYLPGTDDMTDFHDGWAWIHTYRNGEFFIDENGDKKLEGLKFPSTIGGILKPAFYNGRLIVKDKSGSGLAIIDKSGNVVKKLPSFVVDATNFVDGLAWVHISDTRTPNRSAAFTGINEMFYYAIIDINGEFVCKNLYSSTTIGALWGCCRRNCDGLTAYPVWAGIAKGTIWGYHDGKGNIVIEPQFTTAADFQNGMALVEVQAGTADNRKWGWIDTNGNWVIEPKYSVRPSDFDPVSGYARVVDKNENAYIITRNGQTVFGPINRWEDKGDGKIISISPFCNGKAFAVKSLPAGYGVRGNCVVDASFNPLYYIRTEIFGDGMTAVPFKNKFYLESKVYDLDKKSIVHSKAGGVEGTNGWTRVYLSDGVGYVDDSGKVKIKIVENKF